MAQALASFDTSHAAPIHDSQLDFYGKRLATCSSDHTVRIWDVLKNNTNTFNAELKHEASVWQISWAHPKFGSLLASASVDGKITLWRETKANDKSEWQIVFQDHTHRSSVNGISFAPWEYGLSFASCSSDGNIHIFTRNGADDSQWTKRVISNAHAGGVNSINWGTATSPATLAAGPATVGATLAPKRIVSGGCDSYMRIWKEVQRDNNNVEWAELYAFGPEVGHKGWVRDVGWRPNCGIPSNLIATVGDDRQVIFWKQDMEGHQWRVLLQEKVDGPPVKVAWSMTGSICCVSLADDAVVFKENLDGQWEMVTTLKGRGEQES